MAITAERLEVDVTADTSSAKRELDSFSRHTETTAKSSGKAGSAAAGMGKRFNVAAAMVKAAAGTMIAAVGTKTIMAASDLNEVLSKTGVVFGPQAKGVTDAAQQMADQFGISKAVYLDAASGIGLVGKASGLTRKAAAGLSTDFAQLAADASSFYDVPIEEALASMKSGLVGESEPMRRFGVLLSEAAVKTEAYRLGIAKTGAELTEQQKVQARASLIQKGMADASGDLARTQTSVANRLREVKGRLTNFAAEMGGKALPAVEKFLTGLIKAPAVLRRVVSWGKEFIDGFLTPFKPLLDPLGDALSKAAGKTDEFGAALKPMADWVSKNGKSLGVAAGVVTALFVPAMAAAAASAIAAKVAVVASWVAQTAAMIAHAAMAGPRMVAMGAFYVQYAAVTVAQSARVVASWVAQQVAAAASVARQMASMALLAAAYVANGAKMAAAAAATAARVVASWVLMGVQSMIQAARMAAAWVIAMGPVGWAIAAAVAVGVAIYKNWDKIVAVTKAAWGKVSGALSAAWGKIKSVVSGGVKAVIGFVKGNWKKIVAILMGPLGIAVGLIIANWDKIKSVFSSGIAVVKSVVSAGFNAVKGFISGAVRAYISLWTGAWNTMKSVLTRVWGGIKSGVQNGISAVMGFVRGLPGQITGVFSNAGGLLLGAGKAIIQGLLDGIGSMIGSVKSKLGELTSMIPNLKGPYEKDLKLLRKNGRAIIKGLVDGFQDNFPKVKRYLGRLTKWVRAGFGGDMERRLVKRIKNTQGRLRKVMERESRITERLRDQIAKRDEMKETKRAVIDATRQGISSQANVLNAGNNATTIRSSLEAQVAKAREFAANLKALSGMGYPKELIAQVAGAGVEGGAEVAKALLSANSADAAGIGAAFTEINQIAKSQSKALGNMLYNPGIQAANGLIKGLKSRKKDVEQVLLQIAKGMQKALKKALGIKSPSRVMAALGRFVGEGLARGMDATRKRVASAGQKMGLQATNGVKGSLHTDWGPRGPGDGPSGFGPASTGGGTPPGGVHLEFKTYNPVAEPQSRTTNKALDRVANLGLV